MTSIHPKKREKTTPNHSQSHAQLRLPAKLSPSLVIARPFAAQKAGHPELSSLLRGTRGKPAGRSCFLKNKLKDFYKSWVIDYLAEIPSQKKVPYRISYLGHLRMLFREKEVLELVEVGQAAMWIRLLRRRITGNRSRFKAFVAMKHITYVVNLSPFQKNLPNLQYLNLTREASGDWTSFKVFFKKNKTCCSPAFFSTFFYQISTQKNKKNNPTKRVPKSPRWVVSTYPPWAAGPPRAPNRPRADGPSALPRPRRHGRWCCATSNLAQRGDGVSLVIFMLILSINYYMCFS